MAIYRPDQAQFSFASEGAQGADSELKVVNVPDAARALGVGALTPGMSEITYDGLTNGTWVVGDFVRIGVVASVTETPIAVGTLFPYEVRRIEHVAVTNSTDGVIRLDRPIAFNHKNNIQIAEANATANSSAQELLSIPSARFIPGAYTTVTVPDITPTLEPKYFLGNNNRRNFTEVYRGTQAYTGTLSGVIALNGFMLRFGIGDVRTNILTDNDCGLATFLVDGTASKGDQHIYVDGAGAAISTHDPALVAGAFVQIIDKNTVIGYEQADVHDGGSQATYLNDADATFSSAGVQVGDVILNTTDLSVGRVGAVTSETRLTLDSNLLRGGTGNTFEDSDKYLIVQQGQNTLAATAVSGTASAGANTGTVTGTYKVARVVGGSTLSDIFLETPLKEDYADDSFIIPFTDAASSVYQHVITEANLLPTMTWHLRMLDSAAGNPFIRRSLGGMVDSMTISADEGGMLMVGWDTVNFMGTIHNLEDQKTVGTSLYSGDSAGAGMPGFAVMHDITDSDIDFNTTEPYYFSEGTVYIGGVGVSDPPDSAVDRKEFARVRDFNIAVSNQIESRYYVSARHGSGRRRGPNEMREGRREYTFTATISLNDSEATTGNDIGGALELYKQLLLEGNYGSGSQGFNVRLTFIRGVNDTMVIDLPGDATAATGLAQGGVFLRAAPHDITEDPTMQTSIDCVARNMKIVITDGVPVYP